MFIRNAWYVAAWADELDERPLGRTILGEPVVLFRDANGQPAALQDFCKHRGAPLSAGRVTGAGLECGYHGLVYAGDGRCVRIPGQTHIPERAGTRSYPLVEKDACLWIWMGDAAAADPAEILDFPYHSDRKWPHKHTMYPVAGNATLLIDNLMDLTHLGYVHATTIGGNPSAHVDAKTDVKTTEHGVKFTRWLLDIPAAPTIRKAVPELGETIDRWQEFEFIAPACIVQWSGSVDANTGAYDKGKRDGGFQARLFHAITPETEESCHYFWSGANGYRIDDPQATEDLFSELCRAFDQDMAMIAAQQQRIATFGEDGLVNIVADASRVHMRRVLERMAAAERTPPREAATV